MNPDSQLSPSDIAELADVSRAAVSNWRTRYTDFPAPAGGTDARPLFDRSAVISWLLNQGRPVRESSALQVWAAINSLRSVASIEELVVHAHRLLAVRHLADQGNSEASHLWAALKHERSEINQEALARALSRLLPSAPDITRVTMSSLAVATPTIATAISTIDPTTLLNASTLLLERAGAEAARAGSAFGLANSRTAAILAAAASSASSPTTVYDPACGISEAMQTIALQRENQINVFGVDVNADALLISAVRALLRGIAADYVQADVLAQDPHPELRVDLIVAEPPFSLKWDVPGAISDSRWRFGTPPRMSADFAWIQHVIAHLAPGGRGYVLTTRSPLTRGGTEGRIRAELLKHDLIRAVVGLPGKLLPNTSIPLALWVLGGVTDSAEANSVLIIDATDTAQPEDRIGVWLAGAKIEAPHRRVPNPELLAAESALTPARWAGEVAEAPRLRDVQRAIDELQSARRMISEIPDVSVDELTQAGRTVRLSELIEHGTVRMTAGRVSANEFVGGNIVKPADLRHGLQPVTATPQDPVAERCTAPGDVLVTRIAKLYARVDRDGGRIPARGIYVLSPNTAEIDADYLAHCIAGSWNEALQPSSTLLSVKDLEIPMVPLDEQQRIAAQLRALDQALDAAKQLKRASSQVSELLLRIVRHGTVN